MWPAFIEPPKFTTIITSFNYSLYVVDAIRSVKAQTYKNLECIVVDDGSTDGSQELISQTLKKMKDVRFRLIRTEKNLGQMGAMLAALTEATGEFVGFLDADDLWADYYIKTHVEAHLNQSRTAGMSCSDMAIIGKDGQMLSGTWMPMEKPRGEQKGGLIEVKPFSWQKSDSGSNEFWPDSTKIYFSEQSKPAVWKFSPTSACVFRRDLLNIIAPTETDGFRISADYYFIMLASTLTGCLMIEKPCCYYRLHGANAFSNNPIVGGKDWLPGKWEHGSNKKYIKIILHTINQKYDLLSSIFGNWNILNAVRKLYDEFSAAELKSVAPRLYKDLMPWEAKKWSFFKRRWF